MKNLFKLSLLLLLSIFISCSDDDDTIESGEAEPNYDKVLSGKVQGMNFTARGGIAFDFEDDISVNFTIEEVGCDSSIFDYEYTVSTYINPDIEKNDSANVIFNKKGETPLNVLSSTVEILEITDRKIKLYLKSKAITEGNNIEGVFEVDYCKE